MRVQVPPRPPINIFLALMLPVRIRVSFTASSLKTISIPLVRLISVRIYSKTITVKPRDDDIDFIFLSTAGPGFCIVTRNIGKAERVFKSLDMKTLVINL